MLESFFMEVFYNWIYSLFPLVEKGGWVMLPIIGLSMVALAIFLERVWVLLVRSNRIISRPLVNTVSSLLEKGEVEEAVVACRKNNSMISRVIYRGLSMPGAPRAEIREAMEEEGRRESRELERYLGILAAIAGVSPLLGLLGTVLGMIDVFQEISQEHIGQYEHLAGGIYKALYTTAAGLSVAIPTYLVYRGFAGLADKKVREMEDTAVDVLRHLFRSGRTGASEEEQQDIGDNLKSGRENESGPTP
ncbi:MAG: MotA/TolQ/ExbB proton channel family protein [bacterium]